MEPKQQPFFEFLITQVDTIKVRVQADSREAAERKLQPLSFEAAERCYCVEHILSNKTITDVLSEA